MSVKTYGREDVTVIVGGTIVTDFDSVKVAKNDDRFTMKEGSHGEVTRSKKSNKLGSITITLPQTNTINGDFTAYHDADALVEVEVKDNNGESLHLMPQGTFVKTPDVGYEEEAGSHEWIIAGPIPTNHIGGNH